MRTPIESNIPEGTPCPDLDGSDRLGRHTATEALVESFDAAVKRVEASARGRAIIDQQVAELCDVYARTALGPDPFATLVLPRQNPFACYRR